MVRGLQTVLCPWCGKLPLIRKLPDPFHKWEAWTARRIVQFRVEVSMSHMLWLGWMHLTSTCGKMSWMLLWIWKRLHKAPNYSNIQAMTAVSLVNGQVISQRDVFAQNTASVERFQSSESKRSLEFPYRERQSFSFRGRSSGGWRFPRVRKGLRVQSACNSFGFNIYQGVQVHVSGWSDRKSYTIHQISSRNNKMSSFNTAATLASECHSRWYCTLAWFEGGLEGWENKIKL